MVRRFRATAMRATSLVCRPRRGDQNGRQDGIVAFGVRGAPEQGGADGARPPPMKLRPRLWPDWRMSGARPANCLRLSCPSSGSSAIGMRATVGLTPGVEARGLSLSRQAGDPRTASLISPSTLVSSFSRALSSCAMSLGRCAIATRFSPLAFRPDHLSSTSDEIGEQPGRLVGNGRVSGSVVSAKRAITAASIGSILVRCLSALAKDRICAGSTTTTGSPAAAKVAATTISKPAGRLQRNRVRGSPSQACGQTLQSRRIALDHKRFSTRTNSDISMATRASRSAAPAVVRVRWNDELGVKLIHGL
jgi:hypothetical protein